QVVVRAEAEPVDAVLDRARGGKHENAARRAVCGQAPADLVAVRAGQVAVEDDDVVVDEGDAGERVVAVERDVDGHPLAPQPDSDGLRQHFVVFGYEHSHQSTTPVGPGQRCHEAGNSQVISGVTDVSPALPYNSARTRIDQGD